MTPEPSKRGKRKSHPTSKARRQRQKAKKKAARDRESASASGVAAITPVGAGRSGTGAYGAPESPQPEGKVGEGVTQQDSNGVCLLVPKTGGPTPFVLWQSYSRT